MPLSATLSDKLKALPDAPGVYLMKDRRGAVLYVGKAKSLRARVRSYFGAGGGDERPLLPFLRSRLEDVDVLVVENEKEALLLENSLIKQHKPRYNVRLVDDKAFLSLRLDRRQHAFPRFTTVRRPREDGSRHFGPFSSARSVRETLKVVYRNFGIRSCSDSVFANRSRPCLYYQIGQCLAPCVGYVSEPDYAAALDQAELFLAGRSRELVDRLRDEMEALASAEQFEEAAKVRDKIRAIERTLEKQDVAHTRDLDFDVVGQAAIGEEHAFVWLHVRDGSVIDTVTVRVRNRGNEPLAEMLTTLMLQVYESRAVPPEVLLPAPPADAAALAEVLGERRGKPVTFAVPERGLKRRLAELARANAGAALALAGRRGERNELLLRSLQELLDLPQPPRRIECFDMSNLGGKLAVGSMAVAIDGEPATDQYRHYRIRAASGDDDYAMMREVLGRRLSRGLDQGDLPDLLVVDGGRGQLAIARSVAEELGADDVPLLAIAKGPERNAGRELLHQLGRDQPHQLAHDDPRLHLLQRVRDEAHRFAVTYHRHLRSRRDLTSSLHAIAGIGPARVRALLTALGSLAGVRRASLAELARVPGMNRRAAAAVHDHLHGTEAPAGEADSGA